MGTRFGTGSRWLLCALLLGLGCLARGQSVQPSAYATLSLTPSVRTAALGMHLLAVADNDVDLYVDNPSLIHPASHGFASFNFIHLFDGSNFGSALYAHHFDRWGTFVFGLRFLNFGKFEGYDEYDMSTGSFHAGDYLASIGWALHVDSNFSLGLTAKPMLSIYERYTSFAFAVDVAGSYVSDDRRFAATVAARNIGTQIVSFDATSERLPFELTAALSYKLANAPFRFFVEASDLQRWRLNYEDALAPTTIIDPYSQDTTRQSSLASFADNLVRHVLLGVELNVSRVLFVRLGYSYRQMKEMKSTDYLGINFSGFSYGLGIKTQRMTFAFARNNYHLGQAPTYISFSYRF
ncbi:MAG: type IX secretion system protein PorQ [Bacteroidales bacterium]|nr:type IX secretion system protein PorQ [Bacteroidales bacterium]